MPRPSGSFAVQKGYPACLWAFTRNGLHVFYQVPGNTQKKSARAIPTEPDDHCKNENASQTTESTKTCDDIEILALLGDATGNSAANGSNNDTTAAAEGETKIQVRTLGGMRLRLRYIKPSVEGAIITKVTWTMGKKGCFYTEYGVNKDTCSGTQKDASTAYEVTGTPEKKDWSVYWEPLNSDNKTDWSNWAGTQTSDEGVKCTLKAEYTLPVTNATTNAVTQVAQTPYEKDFYIKTRELRPAADNEQPMKGSDVAMLEAMLWEFGLSPQYGFNGKGGTRIDQISDNLAKPKYEYSAGWNYYFGDSTKTVIEKRTASIEVMVRRFKGRSFETSSNVKVQAGSTQDGKVNNDTLKKMGVVWHDFYGATKAINKDAIGFTYISDQNWWANMESALDGSISYFGSINAVTVPQTYKSETHNAMLATLGLTNTPTRQELLKAWVDQESGGLFWGKGDPVTAYRVTEGAADAHGSFGYNQILFRFTGYGAKTCSPLNNINLYHPKNNLLGQIAFAASADSTCGTSFNRAFLQTGWNVNYVNTTAKTLRSYGYKDSSGTIHNVAR